MINNLILVLKNISIYFTLEIFYLASLSPNKSYLIFVIIKLSLKFIFKLSNMIKV